MRLKIPYLPLHTSNHQKSSYYCFHKIRYLVRRKGCLLFLLAIILWLVFVHYYNFIFSILYCVSFIEVDDIPDHLIPVRINTINSRVPLCPLFVPQTKTFSKIFAVNETVYQNLYKRLKIQNGGVWEPLNCIPQHKIALVVPYRDRELQLKVFLVHMHEFLQKQFIAYQIFVIEQSGQKDFNRGKLLNIGFLEANKEKKFDCFIFHDVDLLPLNPNNIYACTKQPRHLSVAIDVFNYELPYCTIFGGAMAIQREQFQQVNGFSNLYFGWGAEDDDFFQRLSDYYSICRFSKTISEYVMLNHKRQSQPSQRLEKLNSGPLRFKTDGLNSLAENYAVTNFTAQPLETRIVVEV